MQLEHLSVLLDKHKAVKMKVYGHQYYLSTRTQVWTLSVKPEFLNATSTSIIVPSLFFKGAACKNTHA